MDGWLSKDLELLEDLQVKFCHDTDCKECYFNNFNNCLGDAVTSFRYSYNNLEHVYTVFINKMKEQF